MDLAALIDLEHLLHAGSTADGLDPRRQQDIVEASARSLGMKPQDLARAIDSKPQVRRAIAEHWLDAMRKSDPRLPGHRIDRVVSFAGTLLGAVGLLSGIGAASTLLAYDGSLPINATTFVAVMFGGQIALLMLMLVALLWAQVRRGQPRGAVQRMLMALVEHLARRHQAAHEALHALDLSRRPHAAMLRWQLFALTQTFGVLFNVGAILSTLAFVTFTDLTFRWSTTLDLDPATVFGIAEVITLPWSFIEEATPTLAMITDSQWGGSPPGYLQGTSAAQASELALVWWKFLVCGLIAWGLLPRLLTRQMARGHVRRSLRRFGFDHSGYQQLFRRLLPRKAEWLEPAPDSVAGTPPVATAEPSAPRAPDTKGAATWLLLWGRLANRTDAVRSLVEQATGAEVRGVHPVGQSELAADERALGALRSSSASRVALLAAAGQQPTKDVLQVLQQTREAIGPRQPLVVWLIEPKPGGGCIEAEAEELAQWKRSLSTLGDPWLWVEAMVTT